MGCACNDGAAQEAAKVEQKFEVSLPNGRKEVVTGEHAARVAVTMAGGGTYSPVR